MPAVIVVVPGVRLMVLCSSVEEKKTVGHGGFSLQVQHFQNRR
jgi:hypothetical protein